MFSRQPLRPPQEEASPCWRVRRIVTGHAWLTMDTAAHPSARSRVGPLDNGAQPGPDRSSALGAFSGLEYGPAGGTRHPKSRSEPVSPNFYGRGDEFLA